MIKKVFLFLAIILVSASCLAILDSESTHANTLQDDSTIIAAASEKTDNSDGNGGTNKYGVNNTCTYMLGFTSWNCNVNIEDQESLKSGIWTIVANVLTDITVAAAYLVLGYVIYGGYLYMSSSGDPGKVSSAKKTLTQAFIGLAIVMSASVILNSIRIALGADSFNENCATGECVDPGTMITSLIQWVIGVAGAVALIFIVVGAFGYITSSGDPSKVQKAKQTILYAAIGLVIVALAEIITAFVSGTIRDANAYQTYQTTIAKEIHETTIH